MEIRPRRNAPVPRYLVWAGEAATAAEALEFYATARTDDAAGVIWRVSQGASPETPPGRTTAITEPLISIR